MNKNTHGCVMGENMEFPGVLKKEYGEIPIKKKWNTQGGSKTNHVEFPGFRLLVLEFPKSLAQFYGISMSVALFSPV